VDTLKALVEKDGTLIAERLRGLGGSVYLVARILLLTHMDVRPSEDVIRLLR
jgi:hypothetical protein